MYILVAYKTLMGNVLTHSFKYSVGVRPKPARGFVDFLITTQHQAHNSNCVLWVFYSYIVNLKGSSKVDFNSKLHFKIEDFFLLRKSEIWLHFCNCIIFHLCGKGPGKCYRDNLYISNLYFVKSHRCNVGQVTRVEVGKDVYLAIWFGVRANNVSVHHLS